MSDRQKMFGIAGWKNSGKTTLITNLISELTARGLTVSSIKHSHHSFDIDHEGRDSFKHRQSGAHEVLVSSSKRLALMHELRPNEPEPDLDELVEKMADVDLILVEGFKSSHIPKIEVMRSESMREGDEKQITNVVAIVSAKKQTSELPIFTPDQTPIFHSDQTKQIADFILSYLSIDTTR